MTASRTARVITEISTPAVSVAAISLLFGLVAIPGWTGAAWGATVALFCGVIPYVTFEIAARRGRITDRHVTKRSQRTWAYSVCIASVLAGVAVVLILDGPALLLWALGTMLVGLVLVAVITAAWTKVSMHTMCFTTFCVIAALLTTPWWILLLAAGLPAIMWSRLKLEHHSPLEAILGAITGAGIATASWALAPL